MDIVFILFAAAIIGLIPAYMAKKKGYSFGLWWLYGWMLFIVAIIHVQFIEDLTDPAVIEQKKSVPMKSISDVQKEKELLDKGIITQQEFEKKKNQLLGL